MNDFPALIQDLRAHAHEAPEHCARLMRQAAVALDRLGPLLPDEVRSAPFPPPDDDRPHEAPRRVKGHPCP